MEDKELKNPHGPEHFEVFIKKIKKPTEGREFLWWTTVEALGRELSQSFKQGNINEKEFEGFRQEIEGFMSEGNNLDEYAKHLSKLEDGPTFWWKKKAE